MQDKIAAQLVHAEVDFFAGGGTDFFVRREDKHNYLDSLREAGVTFDTTQIRPLPPNIRWGSATVIYCLKTECLGRWTDEVTSYRMLLKRH